MSENPIAPVVPPPQPPPLVNLEIKKRNAIVITPKNKEGDTELLNNAIKAERNMGLITSELFRIFKPIDSILQEGPTCGMTALAMALPDQRKTYKELCEMAINNGWSAAGEMYSCDWMEKLARLVGAKTKTISNGIQNHLECMLQCLKTGGFILVPYDKDKDFSPGLFQGTKAHWAIISGILIYETSSKYGPMSVLPCKCLNPPNINKSKKYKMAGCSPDIAIDISDDNFAVSTDASCPSTEVVLYVIAMQGLSNRLRIWPLFTLAASNMNLKAEGDARKGQVVVPPEGVEYGLSGRAVLVWPS